MARLRAQLTYANVMATIAVFVALGGGAYAISRNSVESKHIAPNAAKGSDVKESSLRGIGAGLIGGQMDPLQGGNAGFTTHNPFTGEFANFTDGVVVPNRLRVTDLSVHLENPVINAGGGDEFRVTVNGSPTAVVCSIPAGSARCTSRKSAVVPRGAAFGLEHNWFSTAEDTNMAMFVLRALTR